jgi:hypothetical protein
MDTESVTLPSYVAARQPHVFLSTASPSAIWLSLYRASGFREARNEEARFQGLRCFPSYFVVHRPLSAQTSLLRGPAKPSSAVRWGGEGCVRICYMGILKTSIPASALHTKWFTM